MSAFSARSRALGAIAVAAASVMVLAGCASGSTEQAPAGDLTLKLGTVLPQTGVLSFLGPPEEAGAALAIADVNAANAGITIDATFTDSGDTDNKAFETSVPKLLDSGVDVILGAAASGVSKLIIDQVTGSGVLMISPANTAPDFTTWDDNNLYWRTAPSDFLQGEVLGNLIAEEGHETLGILYMNDAYGSGLEAATAEWFESAGGEVVASESYNVGDTTFDSQISTIMAAKPDAIVIISFEEFKTIAPALIGAGFPAANLYMVDGNISPYGADLPVSIEGAKGTKAGGVLSEEFTTRVNDAWVAAGNADLNGSYTYAAEAYDAVVVTALAALKAGSVKGPDIAAELGKITGPEGEVCTTFEECGALINEGKDINYDGVSSEIEFDENGDPTKAVIGIYQYGADNIYTRID